MGIVVHTYPAEVKAHYPIDILLELCAIPNVKAIKMGQRNMSVYECYIRILREIAPHISLLNCMDEYWILSCYPGVDGGLIGFAACIPEAIEAGWNALKAKDFAATRAAEERIYPVKMGVYGLGQPTGEAHARMKEALRQRGIFSNALMRRPTQPITQEEKDAVTAGLKAAKYI